MRLSCRNMNQKDISIAEWTFDKQVNAIVVKTKEPHEFEKGDVISIYGTKIIDTSFSIISNVHDTTYFQILSKEDNKDNKDILKGTTGSVKWIYLSFKLPMPGTNNYGNYTFKFS